MKIIITSFFFLSLSAFAAPQASLCKASKIVSIATSLDLAKPVIRFSDGSSLRWVRTQEVLNVRLNPPGKVSLVKLEGCRYKTDIDEEVFLITKLRVTGSQG
jgi:hypothetical protein